jgi:hypothetical protein
VLKQNLLIVAASAAQPHTYKVQLLKDEVIPSNSQKVVHCLILGAPADGRNLMIAATGESDIDLLRDLKL